MKKITLLLTIVTMMATISNATVWRVNNRPNVNADFTTLQDAIDGASSGDTLYIEGSTTTYGDGVFDKQLTVIGAGYWLEENDTTQSYKQHSRVEQLTFNEGSQKSRVTGLFIYKYNDGGSANALVISADSIAVDRNYIRAHQADYYYYNYANAIYITGNRSQINIKQNWIWGSGHHQSTTRAIYLTDYVLNSTIQNNFIRAANYSVFMEVNSTANELIISNNVIWGPITTYYSIHVNNIMVEGSYNNGTGDLTSYNLCNGTQYPDANGNQQNIDMSTVFVDYTKYIDNGYFLAPGSPAIGAGISGGDCGAFGNGTGGDPYILSGMPSIPAIFEAAVTPIGTSTLPVNIKATTHN